MYGLIIILSKIIYLFFLSYMVGEEITATNFILKHEFTLTITIFVRGGCMQ